MLDGVTVVVVPVVLPPIPVQVPVPLPVGGEVVGFIVPEAPVVDEPEGGGGGGGGNGFEVPLLPDEEGGGGGGGSGGKGFDGVVFPVLPELLPPVGGAGGFVGVVVPVLPELLPPLLVGGVGAPPPPVSEAGGMRPSRSSQPIAHLRDRRGFAAPNQVDRRPNRPDTPRCMERPSQSLGN